MRELMLIQDLSIVWLAALIAGCICVGLRLPVITGYILAGIVIGPYGIKLINNPEQVDVLADLGVALLLFALGVELSLRQIFSSAGKSILAGLTQIVLTMALAWAAAVLFGFALTAPQGFLFGCICALSSTVIVTKVLMDRGEADATHGKILVAILLVQDLSLVPLISILPALKDAGNGDPITGLIFAMLKGAGLIAVIFWSATKLVPPFLERVAHSGSRELFLLTVLSVCLGVALLSNAVGLSLALGAFLAGIMVSESPYGHRAFSDLLPLRDLFATVFFVSVGMLVNPSFVAGHMLEVVLFVVLLIFAKTILGMISALLVTKSIWSALLVGVGLAQVGEFSFILATLGYRAGLINIELYNLFFAAAVVSIIASPLLMFTVPRLLRKLTWFRARNVERRLTDRQAGPIKELHDHVILCGFGRVGRNLGMVLKAHEIPFVVVETNGAILADLQAREIPHVYGEASSLVVLLRANLRKANCLVVTIPDPIAATTIIGMARHYNQEIKIIARAHRTEDIEIFRATGANAVVQPEFEASLEICRVTLVGINRPSEEIQQALNDLRMQRYTVFQSDISEPLISRALGLAQDDYVGVWFRLDSEQVSGKSIIDLDVRKRSGATVLAIKRDDSVIPHPDSSVTLDIGDELYVFGGSEQLATFERIFGLPRFCPLSEATSSELPRKLND